MGPTIMFTLMIIEAAAMSIIECCGAGMLWTMYMQIGLLFDGCEQSNPPGAGCEELMASLDAELNGCLSCPPLADG